MQQRSIARGNIYVKVVYSIGQKYNRLVLRKSNVRFVRLIFWFLLIPRLKSVVTVDASATGIGAVLSQLHDAKDRPL